MAENLAIKGKLVWFGLVWFSLVWFGFWCCSLLRRSYSTYIPNLSSLSNLCILQLRLIYVDITKKSLTHKQTHKQTEFPTCRRLPFINGSLENCLTLRYATPHTSCLSLKIRWYCLLWATEDFVSVIHFANLDNLWSRTRTCAIAWRFNWMEWLMKATAVVQAGSLT